MRPKTPVLILTWTLAASGLSGGGEPPRYEPVPFRLRDGAEKLLFADLDGDGLRDLVSAAGSRLDVYFQRRPPEAFGLGRPAASLDLPGQSVGWDIDRIPGGSGFRVVALIDERSVKAWTLDGETGEFSPPVELVADASGFLPRGVRYLHFVRDIDGDSLADLVVPGPGSYQIYLRGENADYSRQLRVRLEVRLESGLVPQADLTERMGQTVTIPFLELRDVNGDRRHDLVSRSEDSLDVYLARAGGGFPPGPTYSLDLASVRRRIGEFDPDQLDLSNLTGALRWTYQVEMEDIDRDGIEDVLLREGGKVILFAGTPDGMDFERPRQILKSGGNILTAVLHDEDGDGSKDLWLIRVETVSMGDVFLWLVASGSVDFEAFVYRNEGARFSRRPARKLTLTVSFPALRSLIKLGEDIRERRKARGGVPVSIASLDAPEADDLLVLREGRLQGYLGVSEAGGAELDVLGLLDYRREKDDYLLEIEEVLEKILLAEERVLRELEGREPDLEIPVEVPEGGGELAVLDLNADGIDDVLVLQRAAGRPAIGTLLLSRPPPETGAR